MRRIEPKRYIEYLNKYNIGIRFVQIMDKEGLHEFDLMKDEEESIFCSIKEMDIYTFDYKIVKNSVDNTLLLVSLEKIKYNKRLKKALLRDKT